MAKIIDPDTQQKAATQGGVVKSGSKVILEGHPKTKIYYTTDGSEPDLDSKIFNESGCGPLAGQHEPILVQADTTVKAKAVWGGKLDSEVATYRFTVAGEIADDTDGALGDALVSQSDKSFTDIEGNWAQEDIELLASLGLISSKSATIFDPDSSITRAEFAALLVRALGLEAGVWEEGRYQDVDSTAWYAGSVAAAADQNIVTGSDGGLFKPNDSITREEMAVMITRAVCAAGKDMALSDGEQEQLLTRFKDRNEISSWAMKDAALALREGVVQGMPGDKFAPRINADRAQSAAILKRFLTCINGLG